MGKAGAKKWHLADWSPLGWLETAIKSAGLAFGVTALVEAISRDNWAPPTSVSLVQFAILLVLALGLVAAIFDRLRNREITAMVFIALNNLGHWSMLLALVSDPGPGARLLAFSELMLLGDLVKLTFFKVTGYTQEGVPQFLLYALTGLYALGYAAILALALLA